MKKYFIDGNGEHRFAKLDGSEDQYIHEDWEYIGEDTEDNPFEFPQTLAEAKSKKLNAINAEYEQNVLNIANVGKDEMATWPKQEAEAKAWLADNSSATPVIDNLLIGRSALGESKAELVAKIIANADAYSVAYPKVLGLYQAKQKALEACTTLEQVLAL